MEFPIKKGDVVMKHTKRILSLLLLLSLSAQAMAGCTPSGDGTGTTREETTVAQTPAIGETTATEEATTCKPARVLTVDETYRIVIPYVSDTMVGRTAHMMAETIRDKTGLELAIITDDQAPTAYEITLGQTNRAEITAENGYSLAVIGDSIHLNAEDSLTLYLAAEAILETWLTTDFGLTQTGVISLSEDRVIDLNNLETRRDNSIKIMTQNLRGTDDPDGNSVQKRSERFVRMVQEYQPDLIGTQEHSYSWKIWLEKRGKAEGKLGENSLYGMVGCFNDGPETKSGGMNAIIYRLDRFELLESDTFWLSHTPDVPSVIGSTRDRRICTWAKFKDLQTGEIFIFANTHLDHADLERNYLQAEILLDQLAEIAAGYPLYLSGDFNVSSYSSTYSIVTQALKDSHKTVWTQTGEDWGTYHAYMQYGTEIDFIFHDSDFTAIRYEIITKQYDGYVSDHYGVIVEFVS